MKTCIACKKEMVCVKTGAVLHYGYGHCYSADIFRCPTCGATVAVAAATPYDLTETQLKVARERLGANFIEMGD